MPADIDSEESAAAWLYALAPDSFVDGRNQLVKELRADGRRELAAVVALLRRPTVIAGELNRVLRANPAALEALIDAALDVREGHQDLLEGEEVDINALQRAHRRAARDLADSAERNHSEIHTIVASASLDESLHDRLRAATFAVEPVPQTGFDLLTPTATVTSLSEARARRDARAAAATAASKGPGATTRNKGGKDGEPTGAPADSSTGTGQTTTKAERTPSGPTDATKPKRDPSTAADTSKTTTERKRAPSGPADTAHAGTGDTAPAGSDDRASTEAALRIERDKAAAEIQAASRACELADRRLQAAEKTRAKAQERVTKMEAQLDAARQHLVDTESKYTAAEAATARARERLEKAEATEQDLDR